MTTLVCLFTLVLGSPDPGGAAVAAPLVLPVASAMAEASPPTWSVGWGVRRHGWYHYRYYPALEVYFDPGRNVWFYFESGAGDWRMVTVLPLAIVIGAATFIEVDVATPRPYLCHVQIRDRYPVARYRVVREEPRPRRVWWGWWRPREPERVGVTPGRDGDRGRDQGADKDKDKEKDKGRAKDHDRGGDNDRGRGHGRK